MTLDQKGIISKVPGMAGLHVVAGFSGHGFMHGPIAGQLMAELVADGRAHSVDIAPLNIERFKRGHTPVEVMTSCSLSHPGRSTHEGASRSCTLD